MIEPEKSNDLPLNTHCMSNELEDEISLVEVHIPTFDATDRLNNYQTKIVYSKTYP